MAFDVALGMDERSLSDVLASLFKRPSLKSRIFSGSKQINEAGINATVSFELEAPPVVKLSAPSADQWKKAIKQDGDTAQPTANAMIVTLPKLKLKRPVEGGKMQEGTIPLDAIVTVNIVNNALSYDALAVVIDPDLLGIGKGVQVHPVGFGHLGLGGRRFVGVAHGG